MITSHYSGIKAHCKKMRVKGFVKEHVQGQLTINNINEFIDYSLIEDTHDSVPQEAMRIALSLIHILDVYKKVTAIAGERGCEVTINNVNVPSTEMTSILVTKGQGCVYFT